MSKKAAAIYRRTKRIRAVMDEFHCDYYNAKSMVIAGGGTLLPARRKSKLSKVEIIEFYKTKGVNEIAVLNGTSPCIILRVLQEANVTMRKRGHNEIRVPSITHGHCQQAKHFGMTPYRYVRLMSVLKLGGTCIGCGETDLNVLEINHINGEKSPQRDTSQAYTNAKYEEHCQILAGVPMPHLEVLCCNCNRRHEIERGNIPPIPEEFLCQHRSRSKSSKSAVQWSTRKRSNDGCNISVRPSLKSRMTKRSPTRPC